jgi:hypothetical protein
VTGVSRGCKAARAVTSAAVVEADVVLAVLLSAQMLARVVYQMGVVVLGLGPHWYVSRATVAPAAPPTARVYSATAASSQSSVEDPSTSTRKSATYANRPASTPVLAENNDATSGEETRKPRRVSNWSNAWMDPWPSIVIGRNSNCAPGLNQLIY